LQLWGGGGGGGGGGGVVFLKRETGDHYQYLDKLLATGGFGQRSNQSGSRIGFTIEFYRRVDKLENRRGGQNACRQTTQSHDLQCHSSENSGWARRSWSLFLGIAVGAGALCGPMMNFFHILLILFMRLWRGCRGKNWPPIFRGPPRRLAALAMGLHYRSRRGNGLRAAHGGPSRADDFVVLLFLTARAAFFWAGH